MQYLLGAGTLGGIGPTGRGAASRFLLLANSMMDRMTAAAISP